MRTDARELLEVGVFGSRSRLGDRIEILLRHGRTFSSRTSIASVTATMIALSALMLAGSFAPRWIAFAQEEPRPTFDVASIKINVDGGPEGGFRPMPGGRLTAKNTSLTNLIAETYGHLLYYQVVGGPGWMNSARFDIEARAHGNPDEDRIMLMLQPLLEDRFKLKLHHETRELPVFTLTAARGGIKLKPSKAGSCVAGDKFYAPLGGEAKYCGTNRFFRKGSNIEWNATRIDTAAAAKLLSSVLRRTVVDKTGFTGTFDVHVEWTPDSDSSDAAGPSIFTVLREELGLKLESAKGPVDVLVIDHAEKPDAN
jgi:uncharacterized protein (TIGR03435 family)